MSCLFLRSRRTNAFHEVSLTIACAMLPCKLLPLSANVNQPVIDVLVIYTPNARLDSTSLAGADRSSSQMETDIAASFQGANDALEASGVNFSIRVVHMREVRYRPSTTRCRRGNVSIRPNKIKYPS